MNPNLRMLSMLMLATVLTTLSGPSAATTCIDHENLERPSIGLVLGGGGARGAAHIGVIRKLEELNIPVDYVAGTSMGALVGALYATGMNADELEQTIGSLDWDDLFNDDTRRADRPFRRKRDDDLSLFGPKLGVGKDSSLLPRGAISGQKISFLFESLVADRAQVNDFDDLPIPFRAVASDIATGEVVVLGKGNLALAMRSSMSVPGVFNPVELDGHLLVDGGITDNLPVDVVRAMGADRLIVVDVGSPLTPRDKLNNFVSVFGQMSALLIRNNVRAQLATLGEDDVLVRPDIGDTVSAADFDKSAQAIKIGYAAAHDLETALSDLSATGPAFQAHRATIEACGASSNIVQFVRLENRSRFRDSLIRERLRQEIGKPLDTAMLEEDVSRIYALGFLELVRYEVVTENKQTGVVVHVSQDSRGAGFIEWGLDFAGDSRDNDFNLRLGYLKTDLDDLGSELRVLTQLGDDPGVSAEIYKPLNTKRRWLVRPKLFASRTDLEIFNENGDVLQTFQIDQAGGSVLLAREFGRHASVFAGLERVFGEIDIEIGDPNFAKSSIDDGGYFAGFQWDRLDDMYFPSSGSFAEARYSSAQESLGSDFEYEQLNIDAGLAHTFGRHTIFGIARYATTLDDDAPIHALFRAGGFLRLSGLNDDELVGQHFSMAAFSYRFRLSSSGLLPAYAGTTLEYGNVANDRDDLFADGIFNGSVYLGYNSPIGPFYMGYGWAEGGRNRVFVRIGNILGRGDLSR